MSAEPMHRKRSRPHGPRNEQRGALPWAEPAHTDGQDSASQPLPRLAWRSSHEYLRLVMGGSPLLMILGALLVVESVVPGIPIAVPVSESVVGLLLVGAMLRSGRLRSAALPVVVVLLGVSYLWLLGVSIAADVDWTRRMVRLGMLFLFAVMVATGRLPLRPLVLGMWGGLLINAVLFFAGIAPDYYEGNLSGYLLDKNVAGFVYAVVPLLVLPFLSRNWLKAATMLLGLALVFQTGSRTGLAAMILALAWVALGGRGSKLTRAGVLTAFYFVFIWAEENLASLEVFGDRSGTDWFRGRIDESSWAKVQAALPWGDGAGEAFVLLPPEEAPFFFHNSYWALLVEGGIPLLVLVVAAFAVGGFGIGGGMRATPAVGAGQAAVIVIFLVSFRLGEVFFTVPSMLVLGAAMALWETERRRLRQERRHLAAIGDESASGPVRSAGNGQWRSR